MLNQFPCESLVTVKDCLAAISRRVAGGASPAWLPETFNLQTELPQFIKNYQRRQKRLDYFSYLLFCYIFARNNISVKPQNMFFSICTTAPCVIQCLAPKLLINRSWCIYLSHNHFVRNHSLIFSSTEILRGNACIRFRGSLQTLVNHNSCAILLEKNMDFA